MAVDNLKEFTMQGMVGGLLLTCMLIFSITFMFWNNTTGLGDTDGVFDTVQGESENQLLASPDTADNLLNITANTNPEASQLGSRDIVATGFGAKNSATGYWESSKTVMGWVFSGDSGKMLIGAISGLLGALAYFFITKHIRQGY